MRLIASICALFAIVGAFACASLGNKRERQALDARTRVVECFKRRGIQANDLYLDAVPVRFVWFAQPTCGGYGACFHERREIVVSTMQERGGDWLPDFEVERSLRHEYVHALLSISGLPDVKEDPMRPYDKEPLMEDCEQ